MKLVRTYKKWGLIIIANILIINIFNACVKDKPNPPPALYTPSQSGFVLLLNEGAMGMNNSSLSLLNADSMQINNTLFEQSNGFGLGDVAQDLVQIGASYYVLLNNSGFIRVLDTTNFKEKGRINGLSFPRQMVPIGSEKAYVTHMYRKYISVIDLTNQQVIKTIQTPFPNTEDAVVYQNKVYVSNWDTASPYLYKLNTEGDSIEKTIELPVRAPHSMALFGQTLWILAGNPYKGKPSYLLKFNINKDSVEQVLAFPPNADPIRLSTNATGDSLYFLMVNYNGQSNLNGLYKMSTQAANLPSQAWIPAPTGTYFWSYGIHPNTNQVFLSDPKGFTQQGSIQVHSANGTLLKTLRGGIGTNTFYFIP